MQTEVDLEAQEANNMIKVGDVIQVNEKIPVWTGCLMIVSEVKDFGVLAGMATPNSGTAYLRLKWEDFEYIGKAVFTERYIDE